MPKFGIFRSAADKEIKVEVVLRVHHAVTVEEAVRAVFALGSVRAQVVGPYGYQPDQAGNRYEIASVEGPDE